MAATHPVADHHDDHAHEHKHGGASTGDHGTIVKDPVCGMDVDTQSTKFRCDLGDTSYYFCSAGCPTIPRVTRIESAATRWSSGVDR